MHNAPIGGVVVPPTLHALASASIVALKRVNKFVSVVMTSNRLITLINL